MKLFKIIVFLFSFTTLAQNLSKEELLHKLSDLTCKCSEDKEFKNENFDMVLGLCILESIGKHKNEVEKYYGVDYISKSMGLIGEEVAPNIMMNCPKLSKLIMENVKDEEIEESDIIINGTFIDTNINGFLFVNIKEDSGKTHQLILINSFENAFLITDKVLKSKDKIEVNYFEAVLFNVKSNKFDNYKILNDIKKL